ncbi:sugar ABC transporter substrate-binding protein [Pararhizobium qamdonense]|uniref:sugar ABC transporter substrate-binding protein n=1 Tax=Pararhizobium qamdonense TaxID=3031126 RepID=UPI0023E137F5|nr:sugar ABC transporter substrate-binding protein [Pararhizobium qamdonense]
MKRFMLAAACSTFLASTAYAENIGVTIARADSAFLTIVRNGLEDRAKTKEGVTLQVEDAQNDTSRQLDQVQNFISSGVDAIIVIAVDGDGTPAITKMASTANIPVVYVTHPPADAKTLPETAAFVGSDEKDSGTMETKEVCRLLGGKGDVYVLMGPLNNESSLIRTKDIEEVMATDECKGMTIIDKQSANWDRLEATNIMTNWLSTGTKFDAVIANNDEMAIGAIQAMKSGGTDLSKVVVGGIDATQDGLAAMAAGDLEVTVFQNAIAQGAAAVDAAIALSRKEKVERNIWIPFELVTPDTMKKYTDVNR